MAVLQHKDLLCSARCSGQGEDEASGGGWSEASR